MHQSDGTATPSISAARAYRLWAPTYEVENPVSALDEKAVSALTPRLEGRALLDVGCGTGRRLRSVSASKPKLAVGVDLVLEMLNQNREPASRRRTAVADIRDLPVCPRSMDVVWCRLVIGHVRDIMPVYQEMARVTRSNGAVIVTDFHPDAASAGRRRTFRDDTGSVRTVEHFCHSVVKHVDAARQYGLRLDERFDSLVGPSVESFYRAAGMEEQYVAQEGLPLVLALRFKL